MKRTLIVLVLGVMEGPGGAAPTASPVATAADLHAALKVPGVYRLAAGVYRGNFVAATDGVTLVGATRASGRAAPDATAGYTLVPADASKATLTITASRISITGVSIAQGQPNRTVVEVGSPDVADPLLQPDDVTLDRVEIVAGALGGIRGIAAHARAFTLTRSRIVNFWWKGADSQAFYSANGPGPYTLADNQLQASGENVMWGGGSIRSARMVPSRVVLRGNLIDKPQAWRQKPGSVKNAIEFKAVEGALVEGNVVDGMWKDAQPGHAVVLTPRNPYNDSPWVVVEDVVIRKNRFVNMTDGYWINILGADDSGRPSQQTARITVDGNYTDSVSGIQILRGVAGWLKVVNNTMPNIKYAVLSFEGTQQLTPLEFSRNVVRAGRYGIHGGGRGSGTTALSVYCAAGYVVAGNVIEQPVRTVWPNERPNVNKFLAADGLAPLLDAEGHYIPGGAGW
jgi:hypothetical protein